MNNIKKEVYKVLVKVDKHGNQTFKTNMCKRCGGTGRVFFTTLDDSRCWKCCGTGIVEEYRTVEYTPEQQQMRKEKAILKRIGSAEDQLRAMGFNTRIGLAYRCLGNTFPIKERIKALGGRWTNVGWVMPVRPDFCECQELTTDDVIIEAFGEYYPRQVVRWNLEHFQGRC